MHMNDQISLANQRVSDLADGCLPDGPDGEALSALLSDPHSLQTWHAYHVAGDVLRSAELAPSRGDLAFLERFERRLALEPAPPAPAVQDLVPVVAGVESANASLFRWKMLAGLACTALVGVIGLNQWTRPGTPNGGQMAVNAPVLSAEAPVVVANESLGLMMRDPQLDELMAAHRQLGGHSALQVPAGFLRNATYEGPAR
jgi:sigma-E factor negative regulatory protein RseA